MNSQLSRSKMPAVSISTKYRIAKKALAVMAETIKRVGFEKALRWAVDGSLALLDKEPNAPLATTYLSWSINLLNDSRLAKTDAEAEKLLQLCTLYRML